MWTMPLRLQLGIYLSATRFALLKGDWEERAYAAAGLLASAVTLAAGACDLGSNVALESAEDLVALGLMIFISLRSDKLWPPAVASLTLLAVMTEAAQALLHAGRWAYGTAQLTWNILIDLLLVAGTWAAWRARRSRQKRLQGSPARTAPGP